MKGWVQISKMPPFPRDITILRREGTVTSAALESQRQDRSESGVAEDSAFSIKLSNTSNERTYTTASGLELTLVDTEEDGGLCTTVMVSDGDVKGYLRFRGLSEEEIREVLDTVKLQ